MGPWPNVRARERGGRRAMGTRAEPPLDPGEGRHGVRVVVEPGGRRRALGGGRRVEKRVGEQRRRQRRRSGRRRVEALRNGGGLRLQAHGLESFSTLRRVLHGSGETTTGTGTKEEP